MSFTPLSEAFENLGKSFEVLSTERISTAQSLGRVTAEDIAARLNQPPVAVSSMDGYAVSHEDVLEIGQTLEVIGKSQTGGPFDGKVEPGQTVRIFTGAEMPKGTNCVIVQEDAEVNGNSVTFNEKGYDGKYVRPKGLDFSVGQVLIPANTLITARHIGLLCAMNVPWVQVIRRPVVGVLATGDELVMPGDDVGPAQIISSNSLMVCAMVDALGGIAHNLGIARDNEDSLRAHLQGIEKFDVLVTLGGVSVGDYDLVKKVLGSEGMEMSFYKIAMKPGKPFMHGMIKGTPVMGLPGNPVSSYVTAHVFLRAAIKKMQGLGFKADVFDKAILNEPLKQNGSRMEFLRAGLSVDKDDNLVAHPFMGQDSAQLSVLAEADGFIVRPIGGNALEPGAEVNVIRIKDSHFFV